MPKVEYNNIKFDSELEVEYYKYLKELKNKGEVLNFYYHPDAIQNLVGKRSYTPDFLVAYQDRIEIVECKGYNPYSKMIDDQIHNVMLSKTEYFLKSYICNVKASHIQFFCGKEWDTEKKVVYCKVKYLKAYGFVDWDFKNPNTIANKRKEKINEQQDEIKELKEFKKNAERYFKYHLKVVKNQKLTKPQKEWYYKYVEFLKTNYSED
jgi:hypothetical protein